MLGCGRSRHCRHARHALGHDPCPFAGGEKACQEGQGSWLAPAAMSSFCCPVSRWVKVMQIFPVLVTTCFIVVVCPFFPLLIDPWVLKLNRSTVVVTSPRFALDSVLGTRCYMDPLTGIIDSCFAENITSARMLLRLNDHAVPVTSVSPHGPSNFCAYCTAPLTCYLSPHHVSLAPPTHNSYYHHLLLLTPQAHIYRTHPVHHVHIHVHVHVHDRVRILRVSRVGL